MKYEEVVFFPFTYCWWASGDLRDRSVQKNKYTFNFPFLKKYHYRNLTVSCKSENYFYNKKDFSREGNSLRVDDNLTLFKWKRDAGECSRQNKHPKALLQNSLKQTILAPQCTGNFFKCSQNKDVRGKL